MVLATPIECVKNYGTRLAIYASRLLGPTISISCMELLPVLLFCFHHTLWQSYSILASFLH